MWSLILAGAIWPGVVTTAYPTCSDVYSMVAEEHARQGRKVVRQDKLPDDSILVMFAGNLPEPQVLYALVFLKTPQREVEFISGTFHIGGSCRTPEGDTASYYTARVNI